MKQTVKKWAKGAPKLLLAIVLTTVFFGLVETRQYSAYAVCRNMAMDIKGYGVWKHKATYQFVFTSLVIFSDGYNDVTCQAKGVGPFWHAVNGAVTIVGCLGSVPGKPSPPCPTEDYYGVSP